MPAYLVSLPDSYTARTLQNGHDSIVVFAANAAAARAVAKSAFTADIDAPWDSATVTDLAVATDWATPQLWNFRIKVRNPTTGDNLYNVTVQSSLTNNLIDEIAVLLVNALEAAGGAALTPSYDATGNILTVAAIADNIGTHFLECTAWPVGFTEREGFSGGFFNAEVEGGIAGAVLTVALPADATVPPVFYSAARVGGPT